MGEIRLATFDCYGTLIDWEAGICAVLGPWAREHGLDLADEALLTAYAEHEARAAAESPTVLYPQILTRSFHALAAELGATPGWDQAGAVLKIPAAGRSLTSQLVHGIPGPRLR